MVTAKQQQSLWHTVFTGLGLSGAAAVG
jgi:hypothetical protein